LKIALILLQVGSLQRVSYFHIFFYKFIACHQSHQERVFQMSLETLVITSKGTRTLIPDYPFAGKDIEK